MARLALKLLGSYRLTLNGLPVDHIESDKARALLAYLAVENDCPHSREKLAGIFWAEQDEEHARGSLSQALYHLRGLLGDRPLTGALTDEDRVEAKEPFLLVSPHEIQFNPRCDFEIDITVFTGLVSACKAHAHQPFKICDECLQRFQDAAFIYTGDFMDGFYLPKSLAFEEWATVQREHLRLEMMWVLTQLAIVFEVRRDYNQALDCARKMVHLDELGESGNMLLLRLLASAGKRGEALAHYSFFQHALFTQIGDEPGFDIKRLYRRLHNEENGSMMDNLPVGLAPLVGRRHELAQLTQYLNDPGCRVLTLLGPGGCGKTHLALEVARGVKYTFFDGVYLVSLSALISDQFIVPAVAEALGFSFREHGEASQQLLDYLRLKSILFIMDSFENVLSGTAWIIEVLRCAPRIKFLVTSRSSLKIRDEQIFLLEGMPVPYMDELEVVEQNDAVQLFITFAHHRKPSYKLDELSYPDLVRICQLVDGLPLGLLLASSWVGLYSLSEIAGQIEQNLDFLNVDWSDMPPRQRSMQATFNYSWDLLANEEKRYLTALTVFHGSFSLQAVHCVAGDSDRLLYSLVNKSLVSHISADRYRLHDLVNQYATQKLESDAGYATEVRSRHSRFYLEELSVWGKDLASARQRETLDTMDQEVENLRVAWRWAVEAQDWQGIAQGLAGMSWYADLRFRFQEGELACRIGLDNIPKQTYPYLLSSLIVWRAHFLRRLGQVEAARQLLEDELARLATQVEPDSKILAQRANALYELGELFMYTNREKAVSNYKASLALFENLDNPHAQALVLASLGESMHHTGPLDQAQVFLDRGVTLSRKIGDPRLLSRCILWSGWNYLRQGNLIDAETLIRESIEINHALGDRYAEAFWSAEWGTVKGWMGKFTEGIELLSSSIPIYTELGLKQEVALSILRRGLFEINIMDFQRAGQDMKDCLAYSYQLDYQRGIGMGIFGMGGIEFNEGNYQKAVELSKQAIPILQDVQADEVGWCLALLAYTMRRMGHAVEGWQYARRGLEIASKARVHHTAAMTILAIAALLADEGRIERAVELHALVMRYPLLKSSPWFQSIAGKYIDDLSARLPAEIAQAARERGCQRDLFATAEELLGELTRQVENGDLGSGDN